MYTANRLSGANSVKSEGRESMHGNPYEKTNLANERNVMHMMQATYEATENKQSKWLKLFQIRFRRLHADQKGLTLIELLAVIVILGLIAIIAIPSISGILRDSERSAHITNAQQIVDAARLAVGRLHFGNIGTAESGASDPTYKITIKDLKDTGFLEGDVKDPSKKGQVYHEENSFVLVTNKTDLHDSGAYIDTFSYSITIVNDDSSPTTYFNNVPEQDLDSTDPFDPSSGSGGSGGSGV